MIYLGTTMAQSGQRVLLIDTDMRRPRLHESTGVSRQTGLTNLILGDHDYDDVIKTTEIPNLFVLPCGPLPPNPAELLMTQAVRGRARRAREAVRSHHPRLTAAAGRDRRGGAVEARRRRDPRRRARARRCATRSSAPRSRSATSAAAIFGVIVNEIDAGDRSYYSYGYGYGYGYDAKDPEPAAEP